MNSLRLVVILAFVACARADMRKYNDKQMVLGMIESEIAGLAKILTTANDQANSVTMSSASGMSSSLNYELNLAVYNHLISCLIAAKRIIIESKSDDPLSGKREFVFARLRAIGSRRALREYNRIKSQNNSVSLKQGNQHFLDYVKTAIKAEMNALGKTDAEYIGLIDRRAALFGVTI